MGGRDSFIILSPSVGLSALDYYRCIYCIISLLDLFVTCNSPILLCIESSITHRYVWYVNKTQTHSIKALSVQ